MCDFKSFSLRVKRVRLRVFNCVQIWNKDRSLGRVNTSTLFYAQSQIKGKKYEKKKEEGKFFQNALKCSGELARFQSHII